MEFPHLQQIYATHRSDDFELLAVETTNRSELAKEFVKKYGATFPIATDDAKMSRERFELLGVPTTFLIDREGRIIFRHLGFSQGDEKMLEAEIRLLLERDAAAAGGSSEQAL